MKVSVSIRTLTAAAALCSAVLLFPSGASAQDEVDNECVQACFATLRTCSEEAREAADACRAEAACDELAAAAREACQADRDSEECAAARDAVHECVAPCKDALRAANTACRDASMTCLRDECGITELPPKCRPGRGPRH